MPGWNSVLAEIQKKQSEGHQALDIVRRRYLAKLHKYTKRNVIAYYSGWLQRPPQTPNLEIGGDDKSAFMTAVHGLDRSLGLDLFLHTPGGNIAATESLVDYLWSMFNKDVRVIVPQLAMSAGTMIACASRSIVMGKQSNLGPIDPQFGGIAAQAVIDEFQLAVTSIKLDPASAPLWQAIVGKYHPTFLLECMQAIVWSREMVKSWLQLNMFAGRDDAANLADVAVRTLADHADTKTHSRHLPKELCHGIGLTIEALEDDPVLQDLVLTIHHAFMHTFSQTGAIKIIENQRGATTALMLQQMPMQFMPQQFLMQQPPQAQPVQAQSVEHEPPAPEPPQAAPIVPDVPDAQ